MPIYHTSDSSAILGLDYWPVHWPTWKDRKRVPAVIAPHKTTNVVFSQTRTSDHPKSTTIQVSYTAGGNSYTLTEEVRVLVAVKCWESYFAAVSPRYRPQERPGRVVVRHAAQPMMNGHVMTIWHLVGTWPYTPPK